ncbi:hypothetical protein [Enterocloster clostridioformis]|uniref:hypothetical protein n=1 Tax=Enterocloster clostridioformis TaxID=1531 RepID=UPI001A9A2995|nr:hypothetical protein [Enterocloster clostridioformis]
MTRYIERSPLCNTKQRDDLIIVLGVNKERAWLGSRSVRRRHRVRPVIGQDEK